MNTPISPKSSFNPWPVGIIIFFALAIAGAVTFVVYCTRHQVDLVASDYYEQEVRYQDQMERAHRAASLEAPATVGYDEGARRITISLPAGQRDESLKGWIQLYRPSSAGLDQKFPLQLDSLGAQVVDVSGLADGLWHVRVSWNTRGADYYYDQKLIVGQKPS